MNPIETLKIEGGKAGLPGEVLDDALGRDDPFTVIEWLVPRRGELPPEVTAALGGAAEALLREKVFAHPGTRAGKSGAGGAGGAGGAVTPVVFGTGGHRGEIGAGLTLLHVHAIVTALVENIAGMTPGERSGHFGAARLEDVQSRGFVLGHDNRLFNPEFTLYAGHLLQQAGYRVRYAGRITSPELSLLVPERGWAGSLNFTPSHNPLRYGGIKFAPADGGLAGEELTGPLAMRANELLERTPPEAWPGRETLEAAIAKADTTLERVDLHDAYLNTLNDHPVIRLAELVETLKNPPPGRQVFFVTDPVWGAAVPVYQRLLARIGERAMRVLHTETDPYFGGQVTEPNANTLSEAIGALGDSDAPFKVAIRNDPDGDRGLVGDEGGACKMNRYAAAVMAYLLDIGLRGALVTTHATSHLGPDFARARGCEVHLTATGFKNFRPFLKKGDALLAYEESDGMTIQGHTLDKDGVLAGLLALRMVLHYGKPLSEIVDGVEREVGRYHYRQETFMIDMPAAEAKQRLQKLSAVEPGSALITRDGRRIITGVNTEDGFKFSLEGGAWVMMRPSGTEPKVRIYAESKEGEETTRRLCEAAKKMALEAMGTD